MNPRRAVIITALPVEYLAVRDHLAEVTEVHLPQGTIVEQGTYRTDESVWTVAIAEVGAGNPGATLHTERLIAQFQPSIILFVGVAGGMKDAEIGDVVVGRVVHGYESAKLTDQTLTRPNPFRSDYALLERAKAEARKTDWLARIKGHLPASTPNVILGAIAAGEKVLASTASDVVALIQTHYNDTQAVEMEGIGFLHAAEANQSVRAIVIRGISDCLDKKAEADKSGSQGAASRHASAFAYQLLHTFKEPPGTSPSLPIVGGAPAQRQRYLRDNENLSRARCLERWQALGLTDAQAQQLYDDPRSGDLITTPPYNSDRPVSLIVGHFGIGKSLFCDRIFQRHVRDAGERDDAPLPVYLHVRDIVSILRKAIEGVLTPLQLALGAPLAVVIDGLEESGAERAHQILSESRLLANAYPGTSFLLNSRPSSEIDQAQEKILAQRLPADEQCRLIETAAGTAVSEQWLKRLPEPIRESISYPLFALLLGVYIHEESKSHWPKGKTDLLAWLVNRSLLKVQADRTSANALLQRAAAAFIASGGKAVPSSEVGTRKTVRALLDTRLVVEDRDALVFPVPVIAQWFAAQSLLAGTTEAIDLLSHRAVLDNWHYPLTLVLATGSHSDVTRVFSPIVRSEPGFAAPVVKEALSDYSPEEDISAPSPSECASRIREAMQAWLDGLGPLSQLLLGNPIPAMPSLGVTVKGNELRTSWYTGDEEIEPVVDLETEMPIWKQIRDWPSRRITRIGRQSAWAWRLTQDYLADAITEMWESRALPVTSLPMIQEESWRAACWLKGYGPLDTDPIPTTYLQARLQGIDPETTYSTALHHTPLRLDVLMSQLDTLEAAGETEVACPWPGPDLQHPTGRNFTSYYSAEQVVRRAEQVFSGVLEAYTHIVERWFPSLAPRMRRYATLPARLIVTVFMAQGMVDPQEHHLCWYLDPFRSGSRNSVEVHIGEPEPAHDNWRQAAQRLRQLRGATAPWLHGTLHYGHQVFHGAPVTAMVYEWLHADLKEIYWISGVGSFDVYTESVRRARSHRFLH